MSSQDKQELRNSLTISKKTYPVNSYNEWDLLEEVIVGSVEGAMLPSLKPINKWTFPVKESKFIQKTLSEAGGIPYPQEMIAEAHKELNEFIHILEIEGVKVRRVKPVDFSASFSTPAWEVKSGFCAANPRDAFLVIGNEIIEAPMADRNRYFESWAYRELLKEYFQAGAKWTAAPKPQLFEEQYDRNFQFPKIGEPSRFVITEFEPTFDAADFVRCGKDIFGQKSHVTNSLGIEWLQRHLEDKYCIHTIESHCPEALHIDTTLMPLAPGKVLVNPKFLDIDKLPKILKSWDILVAPYPNYIPKNQMKLVSDWVGLNVLMLDEKRIIVEKNQKSMIKALKNWGFKPIICSFESYYPFLGSFHCATLDIRRRGTLQSYF